MPHFVLNHGPLGPLIDIYLTASAQRIAVLNAAGTTPPQPVLAKALVDTGASHTSFDTSIVAQLNVSPTGIVSVITPSTGATPCEMFSYDLGFHIPFPTGQFWSKGLWVATAADLLHQGFGVLLGRDLLSEGMLLYDGKHGTFTLGF
jgi:hypothetical protein